MLYACAHNEIYVEFENEAVYNSFKQLEKATDEVRDWVMHDKRDDITYAEVTQEWLDAMNDAATGGNCKRNADGTWTVAEGLDGWYAQDIWECISDGLQDEDED